MKREDIAGIETALDGIGNTLVVIAIVLVCMFLQGC